MTHSDMADGIKPGTEQRPAQHEMRGSRDCEGHVGELTEQGEGGRQHIDEFRMGEPHCQTTKAGLRCKSDRKRPHPNADNRFRRFRGPHTIEV